MNSFILFIDTSHSDKLMVNLKINKKEIEYEESFDFRKSQGVLPLIDKVIKENGLKFSDISAIKVNTGPGSFTGLRVGVCIANTLGNILQIPINNQRVGILAEPTY